MIGSQHRKRHSFVLLVLPLSLALLVPARPAFSQQQSGNVELRGTLGTAVVYLDESPFPSFGGSVRFYVARQLSVEPELIHLSNRRYPHTVVLGKVSLDFGKRFYTSAGLGYIKRGGWAGDNGLAWSARLGWKLFSGTRTFIAPEIGGGVPGILATINVGVSFHC